MEMHAFIHYPAKIFAKGAAFAACLLFAAVASAAAQSVNFGINLSGGKEPVKIDADDMEMRDKDGIAVLTGNVSVAQGDRIVRAGKMTVYYSKAKPLEEGDNSAAGKNGKAKAARANGLGAAGIDRLEVTEKVYIKNGKQIAVGDNGVFNAKTNIMVLTGTKVVLSDGENVAGGCKLTAHMDSGKALLESCSSSGQKGRVSVIVNRNGQN